MIESTLEKLETNWATWLFLSVLFVSLLYPTTCLGNKPVVLEIKADSM